jgi:hypothetical protein
MVVLACPEATVPLTTVFDDTGEDVDDSPPQEISAIASTKEVSHMKMEFIECTLENSRLITASKN